MSASRNAEIASATFAFWRRVVVNAAILLVTVGYVALLARYPRLFTRWPFAMHFYYNDKTVLANGFGALLPLALSVILLVFVMWRFWGRPRMFVVALCGCAMALQLSWSLLEGRAAERISSTLLSKHYGHSEFVALAHDDTRLVDVARQYETLVANDPRFVYARSKPPGQLLFYMVSVRLFRALGLERVSAHVVEPLGFFSDSAYAAFGPFATLLFVTLSCLPVFLLPRLGAVFAGPTTGQHLCLAFVLMPATNLITMHMDQVLYPLLLAGVLYTVGLGLQQHPGYALAAALFTYVAIYVSFSLVFLLPTIGLLLLGHATSGDHARRTVIRVSAIFAVGVAASAALFYLVLNFQPVSAYTRALAHHRAWMDIDGIVGVRGTIHNFYEFSVWVGIPGVLLYVANWYRVAAAPRAEFQSLSILVLVYPFLLLGVSVLGASEHEIGRLWLPLATPALLPVARELGLLHGDRRPWLFVTSSLIMIAAMKNYQDFQ